MIKGDLGSRDHAFDAIKQTVDQFGQLDIVINNAAQQWLDEDLTELSEKTLRRTFDSNVMSYFFCTQAALPHLSKGATIINTSSVNAFAGMGSLISYPTTRVRRWRSPVPSRRTLRTKASASIPSPPARSGPRSSPAPCPPMRSKISEPAPRWVAPASHGKSRPRSCSSPPMTAIITRDSACTPMAGWSSVHKPLPAPWPAAPLIYELYPRSFQDSTGNGIGDLAGILRRIDHLTDLSVDAVWVCPFMASPWVDGGYDVSDYETVHPDLGTLDDWGAVVDALHQHGIRVMADLVLNHTSNQHPWFEKSAKREDGFDDYYVWRDAKEDGSVPNNWIGRFGNPAWTWDHRRQQYYLHNYMAEQPALNLRCDGVQADVRRIFQHWIDRGVDGFRLDAVTSYLCDEQFRDNPPASDQAREKMDGEPFLPYVRQDHLHDFLPGDGAKYTEKLRGWAGENTYLLGEIGTGNQSIEVSNDFMLQGRLDAGYVVDIAQFGFTADVVADVLTRRGHAKSLAWWTGSHDRARQVQGPDDPEARLQLAFLALMPGPALVYQCQELGLPQPDLSKDEATDPYDLTFWPDGPGREGSRVPMPWTANDGYGFTTGTPWLPMRWAGDVAAASQTQDHMALPFARDVFAWRRVLGIADLPDHSWDRIDDLIVITYPAAVVVFNLGDAAADVPPSAPAGTPTLKSWADGTARDGALPTRSATIWRR